MSANNEGEASGTNSWYKHTDQKTGEIALTYIHGIGTTSARSICDKAGITQERRINDLTEDELSKC